MSITNGSEPAPDEQYVVDSKLYELVSKCIRNLGLPFPHGDLLSKHAVRTPHEDVPDGAVMSPEEAAARAVVKYIPRRDPKIPARLLPLQPPVNFGAVLQGQVYRSGYPNADNYGFLKSLKLKTILTLVPEPIAPEYTQFVSEHGIRHLQICLPANKGAIRISSVEMVKVLEAVLDRSNYPLLIHCNKGKHRTGCTVGCFRRVLGEGPVNIFTEYHTYADPKARLWDEAFIELFDETTVLQLGRKYDWILPNIETAPPSPIVALNVTRSRA